MVTDVLGGIKWEISTQYAFILKKNKKEYVHIWGIEKDILNMTLKQYP